MFGTLWVFNKETAFNWNIKKRKKLLSLFGTSLLFHVQF